MRALHGYLNSGQTNPPPLDGHQCSLERWLDAAGPISVKLTPESNSEPIGVKVGSEITAAGRGSSAYPATVNP